MNAKEVDYFSFENSKTMRLTGDKNGQSNSKKDIQRDAYNKGFHLKGEALAVEKSRRGYHGIGKIASNAELESLMMYYARL